jgi:hypothetical protein
VPRLERDLLEQLLLATYDQRRGKVRAVKKYKTRTPYWLCNSPAPG